MSKMSRALTALFIVPAMGLSISSAWADNLPSHMIIQQALRAVVAEDNGGFGLQMWVSVVDRDGMVRNVAYSGKQRGD